MDAQSEYRDEPRDDPASLSNDAERPDPAVAGGFFSRLQSLTSRLRIARTAALGLVVSSVVFLAGLGAWLFLPAGEAGLPAKPVQRAERKSEPADRLVKEDLAPFYIPLPSGADGRMARVNLVVTWDRPASNRFRNQQVRVRDRLYRRMTRLAAEGENLRSMSLTVRAEARNILEELLRPDEIHVVITGIFVV